MRRPPRDARRGMTLAELLIALAVTALAIGIVAEGARRVLDFQGRIDASRVEREEIEAAMNALRVRLERSLAVRQPADDAEADGDAETRSRPAGGDDEDAFLFAGDATGFRFVAADPAYPSRPGVYEYEIRLEIGEPAAATAGPDTSAGAENTVAGQLYLGRARLLDLAEFGVRALPARWAMTETAVSLSFEYGDGTGGWSSEWAPEDGMPAFLRVLAPPAETPLLLQRLAAPRAASDDSEAEPDDDPRDDFEAGDEGPRLETDLPPGRRSRGE